MTHLKILKKCYAFIMHSILLFIWQCVRPALVLLQLQSATIYFTMRIQQKNWTFFIPAEWAAVIPLRLAFWLFVLLLPPKFVTLFWELMVGRIKQFTLDATVAFGRCVWLRSLSESLCTWQQIKINIRLGYQNPAHEKLALPHNKNTHVRTLTFTGPCIVIYSYNKSQRDALFLNLILVKNSTRFGQIHCSSCVYIRFQNVFLHCATPRLHRFLFSH
jgi:hypothetical protein